MKRRMLSVLLSVMLVIATICVSNMPSRAVEPEDEMTQDEMWYASENSETTTEELAEETTDDEKASENIASTETIVDAENSEAQTDAVNESVDEKIGQENGDGITEADAVNFDADMDTAEDIENSDTSVENDNADKMLPDEGEIEEAQEEITEEMLEGAEVEKLENVRISIMHKDIFDSGSIVAGKEYEYHIDIDNNNEFDIYLSCLKCYVIDENGNEYNVPVSVKTYNGSGYSSITNATKGYLGYDNESVSTDEKVPAKGRKYYTCSVIVPEQFNKGGCSFRVYEELVRLDDTSGKIVASYSEHHIDDIYIENNYYITEDDYTWDENVDINVYHDGYIIVGAKTNFYIQISNNNDFDIYPYYFDILRVFDESNWNEAHPTEQDDGYVDWVRSKSPAQIIDSNGKNIVNHAHADVVSYEYKMSDMDSVVVIKAGETVTYRVDLILDNSYQSKDDGDFGVFGFHLALNDGGTEDYWKWYTFAGYSPTVSVDKEDEDVPNMKLDSDAYEALINSAFTELEIKSGKHLKVDLIIAAVAEASVEQNDLKAIKAVAKKRKIAVILDMNIVRFIDGIISGNVNELDKEIIMTIDVPKEFQAANRKFSIIRLHDGIAEELPDLDNNPNTVTFSTGKFSLYALIYEDVEGITTEPSKSDAPETTIVPVKDVDKTQQAPSPNTGDSTPIAVVFILMLVAAFFAVISVKHIKKNK